MEAIITSWALWLGIHFGLGTDFQVVRAGDRLTIRGKIPRSKLGRLGEFFRRDLAADAAFAVAGRYGPGGSLRLRWAGRLDRWSRQRVRNVLVEVLS